MRYWNNFAYWLRRNFGITPEMLFAGIFAIVIFGWTMWFLLGWAWTNRFEITVAIIAAIKLIGAFVKSAATEAGVNLNFDDFFVGLGTLAAIKWCFSSKHVHNRNVNNNYNSK